MTLRDYCYDGDRKLSLKDAPTGAGDQKANKEELTEKTRENMARVDDILEEMNRTV